MQVWQCAVARVVSIPVAVAVLLELLFQLHRGLVILKRAVLHLIVTVVCVGQERLVRVPRFGIDSSIDIGLRQLRSRVRADIREHLREAFTVLGNALVWISEWQSLPGVVVNLLAIHVNQALLARCASSWSQMLLAEHSIFFILIFCGAHVIEDLHDFPNVPVQLIQALVYFVLGCKHLIDLIHHISHLVHKSVFKVDQVLLVGLVRHLLVEVVDVLFGEITMFLELISQSGQLIAVLA